MTEDDWTNPHTRCLGLRLDGDAIAEVDARGDRIVDDTVLMLFNAHHAPVVFCLPPHRRGMRWEITLDTRDSTGRRGRRGMRGGDPYRLEGRNLALLRLQERP